MIQKPLATVPPIEMGSTLWAETVAAYLPVAVRRGIEDPQAWAEYHVRRDYDRADLRALGRCLDCGQPMSLRQIRRVIVMEPCGHWRAHGDLRKVGRFLEERRRKMTPERRASVLELVGGI